VSTLIVNTSSRQYTVTIGSAILDQVVAEVAGASAVVIATDENVDALYSKQLSEPLEEHKHQVHKWVMPAGERYKSLHQAGLFYDFLVSNDIDRYAVIVALGGGVVGDLAGFAASTWLRGVKWINCPTTLLAAIDAGIGGKTAVNHGHKNAVGTFYQPQAVLIDVATFKTLPDRDYRSALAEAIKHAVITDGAMCDWMADHATEILDQAPDILEELVLRNLQVKSQIVERDERDESGERAKLNFGHTIGHALETATEYRLNHGESVGLGMLAAAHIAEKQSIAATQVAKTLKDLLSSFGLPTSLDPTVNRARVREAIRGDKKFIGGRSRLVLPRDLGDVVSGCEVPIELLAESVDSLAS